MRIALIGYGAVAAAHARALPSHAELAAVFGPDPVKAEAFARAHGAIRAATDLETALCRADAAIVCSPSPRHYEHAAAALAAGVSTLVELPACASLEQARRLDALARAAHRNLQCAHTSRYLEPYRRIGGWIRAGVLGEIRQVTYVRAILPRTRSWTDDALLHHAEHPLDLFLNWFGAIRALGCAAHPGVPGAQSVALLGSLNENAPVTISISYEARLAEAKMTLAGSRHTVATDGFGYIESDNPELSWKGDREQAYEQAIAEQDHAFLNACVEGHDGVPWQETIGLTACMEDFAKLWNHP